MTESRHSRVSSIPFQFRMIDGYPGRWDVLRGHESGYGNTFLMNFEAIPNLFPELHRSRLDIFEFLHHGVDHFPTTTVPHVFLIWSMAFLRMSSYNSRFRINSTTESAYSDGESQIIALWR